LARLFPSSSCRSGSPRNDQPGTPSSPPPSPEGSPPKGSPDRKRGRSNSPSRSPKRRRHDSPTSRRADSPRRDGGRDRRSPPRDRRSPPRDRRSPPRRDHPRDRSPRRDFGRRDDHRGGDRGDRGAPRRDFQRPEPNSRERSIYIGNLPYDIRRDEVRVLCEKYGEVYSVTLGARGFGFVAMDPRGAQLAVSGLDGRLFGRRTLHVNEAFVEPTRR